MVSLHSPNDHRTAIPDRPENDSTTLVHKRKALEGPNYYQNHDYTTDRRVSEKRPKSVFQNFMADDIELHLETPLPSEWQRCLDIQSGKIHFYNTKTHARTSTDPRKIIPDDNDVDDRNHHHHHHQDNHMSLDLELNLTTSERYVRKENTNSNKVVNNNSNNSNNGRSRTSHSLFSDEMMSAGGRQKSGAAAAAAQEMVATVCRRCHMLVMLCRSTPACPNCKFVHSPDNTPSSFVQPVKL